LVPEDVEIDHIADLPRRRKAVLENIPLAR
jgi:hypothetical protein